jgi:hypothetical protein
MTIIEAITKSEASRPGLASDADKIRWLSALDGRIKCEVIGVREGSEWASGFVGYDEGDDVATDLLVPPPYDELYLRYLEAQIDYETGEIARYNNAAAAFSAAYDAFLAYYHRTHAPLARAKLRYF